MTLNFFLKYVISYLAQPLIHLFSQLSSALYCSGVLISIKQIGLRESTIYGLSLTLVTYITLAIPCSILGLATSTRDIELTV